MLQSSLAVAPGTDIAGAPLLMLQLFLLRVLLLCCYFCLRLLVRSYRHTEAAPRQSPQGSPMK